jgi:DNA-binding NtrC family response regulator
MMRLRESIRAAGESRLVVLRGEPGVGKSLAAKVWIAQASRRREHVFRIRCSGIGVRPAEKKLLELSRLCDRREPCTLSVDEIGEADGELQAQLCRMLVEFSGSPPLRVVATTVRDLERMVRKGLFRPELCTPQSAVWIPPLRVRRMDIPDLVRHFLEPMASSGPDSEGMQLLEQQEWPRNVRQLREVVRRLGLLYDHITAVQVRRELLHVLDERR